MLAVWLFGFDSGVRRKLLIAEESGKAVCLENCEVKRSRARVQVGGKSKVD